MYSVYHILHNSKTSHKSIYIDEAALWLYDCVCMNSFMIAYKFSSYDTFVIVLEIWYFEIRLNISECYQIGLTYLGIYCV